MMRAPRRDVQDMMEFAVRTLQRWRLAASENGLLWIRPAGPTLDRAELAGFLHLLEEACAHGGTRRIVFDFAELEFIGPRWTLVLAELLDFARKATARCALVSVRGQPAAVTALYRMNRDVAALLTEETPEDLSRFCEKASA